MPKPSHANAGIDRTSIRSQLANIATAVLPVFPPDPNDWRPFFLDIWEGSGNVSLSKMLAHRDPATCTVIIRSGQGHPTTGTRENFYKDMQYEANVQKAVMTELPWQQYHVFLPNYRDTRRVVLYARERMETVGHFPCALWWDHQLKNYTPADTINSRLRETMEWSAELIPEVVIQGIYVAKWVYDQIAAFREWMNTYYFWWAKWRNTQESSGVSQIDLPYEMLLSRVIQQQTTSHGDGRLFGYPTSTWRPRPRADYNRALLPMNEYMQLLDVEHKPQPTGLENRVLRLEQFKDYILEYKEQEAITW